MNALLKDGKTVGLVTKGKHEGDYVVKSDDLGKVKGDYVLTVTEADEAPAAERTRRIPSRPTSPRRTPSSSKTRATRWAWPTTRTA